MRVVFDTNTIVSALLFSKGRLSWLRGHWQCSHVHPLVSKETADEIIRVLSYPKFRLDKDEIQSLLADYLPYAETVVVKSNSAFPQCKDVNDQMFIDLALQENAEVLVSGDSDLLEMDINLPIETPAQYEKRIRNRGIKNRLA
jgi:putative PIN family toxin of toxin-antitoxin system